MSSYIKYFRNSEIKNTIRVLFLIFTLFISVFSIICYSEVSTLNKNYIKQNTLIVGKILNKNPNLENEIVQAISNNSQNTYENKDYKLGKEILDKYSYNKTLSIFSNSPIKIFFKSFCVKIIAIIFVFIAIIFIILITTQINFYKKIEAFSKSAEKVIEGSFEKLPEKFLEGEFYVFTYQFNLMIDRLQNSMENLKKEKIFLKNIISDISHQLKTPLSSLIMFNELMNTENISEKDRKNFLELSSEQLKRMEWLIKNLLKLGRLEAGVIKFNKDNNPLYVTINKALSGLVKKAEESKIKIQTEISKDIYFNHDMDWTAEALSNILKNAIEHIKENGEIKVIAEETPLSVSIKIIDNGVGIPKEILGKVFERFYKGENSVNPNSIGIGLSLCKSIIESQNGSVNVKSKVDKGTEFEIIFLKSVI